MSLNLILEGLFTLLAGAGGSVLGWLGTVNCTLFAIFLCLVFNIMRVHFTNKERKKVHQVKCRLDKIQQTLKYLNDIIPRFQVFASAMGNDTFYNQPNNPVECAITAPWGVGREWGYSIEMNIFEYYWIHSSPIIRKLPASCQKLPEKFFTVMHMAHPNNRKSSTDLGDAIDMFDKLLSTFIDAREQLKKERDHLQMENYERN